MAGLTSYTMGICTPFTDSRGLGPQADRSIPPVDEAEGACCDGCLWRSLVLYLVRRHEGFTRGGGGELLPPAPMFGNTKWKCD